MHARGGRDALTVVARPRLPPVSRPGDVRESQADRAASAAPHLEAPDFGRVRIHADEDADRMARAVGARAFAIRDHVFFRRGEYAPHTESGSRLLAHELAHAAQHNTDALHRVPGSDAPDSWRAITEPITFRPDRPDRRGPADEAVARLLRLAGGARVVNQLWQTFCAGRTTCRSRIRITFVDADEVLDSGEITAGGHFSPSEPDAPLYEILVRYREPLTPDARSRSLGGSWPGGSPRDIHYTHADSESSMASTLHHELLHVWFIHAHRGDAVYPTGHQDVMRGEIDPRFEERLRAFSAQLDELEREARARAQPVPPPGAVRNVTEPREPARAQTPAGPGFVGAELSLQGGGLSGPGGVGRGAGIVGADLVLGNIYSLRLGARGVYLTPENLFAGGTVGFRVLQSPDGGRIGERVQNPLFFDVEAGILAELTPNQAARVSNGVVGIGSAGVGQEFGTSGPRFFWRVGGMVVISDRDTRSPAVGGTGGAGVRF